MPMVPQGAISGPQDMTKAPASPANFLLAAADLHQSGQLSAPVPTGKALGNPAQRPRKRLPDIKVVK